MATRRGGASIDRLEAENEYLRRGGIAEEVGKTVRVLLIVIAVVALAFFLSESMNALAGKQTDANILIKLLGVVEVSVVLSWVVGGAGVIYGRAQAKLRKSAVERLHKRVKELESALDPSRTSSKLTPRGDTNPEDF